MKTDTTSMDGWDDYFMKMADLVASKSKDRSMKCGCVVVGHSNTVLSTGYNGFPRGVNDEDEALHKRPTKYIWTAHDAVNAIYNAARNGTKLLDSRAYLTAHPCQECARGIAQAGIIEVIFPTKHDDPFYKMNRWTHWEESFLNAREIFKACGVMVTEYGI
jgi:dCMP deaminase